VHFTKRIRPNGEELPETWWCHSDWCSVTTPLKTW
jgi:hypothetical protein